MNKKENREAIKLKCKNDWDIDLTEDQISMCIIEMEKQGLDLFNGQIWPNKRKYSKKKYLPNGRYETTFHERITWDKSIDGYRAVAHKSGMFAGVDAPVFTNETGEDGSTDLVARVTVYRYENGQRFPYTGEARFSEFVQQIDEYEENAQGKKVKTGKKVPNKMWGESPRNQLGVSAERQALRKAFQSAAIIDNSVSDEVVHEETRGEEVPDQTPGHVQRIKSDYASKFVSIPEGGFKNFGMYEGSRIVLCVHVIKNDSWVLGLDSGEKVTITRMPPAKDWVGKESARTKRSDSQRGGREWIPGDVYYTGEVVEKTAPSKKEGWLRIKLSTGYEVKLDGWGKEMKRIDRNEEKTKQKKSESSPSGPVTESPQGGVETEAQATGIEDNVKKPEDFKPNIKVDKVDIESITDINVARNATVPLLKKWCVEVINKRLSPKEAYHDLTGVLIKKGNNLTIDDWKVLHACLEDAVQ